MHVGIQQIILSFETTICICISVSIHLCSATFYDVPLWFNAHMYACFQMRAQSFIICQKYFRCLPRSTCYSGKTCLMYIICTPWYIGCSNGTMNDTSMELKIRIMSQIGILYLIRHASGILIVGLHLLRRMPRSEHCWKKNSGTKWARNGAGPFVRRSEKALFHIFKTSLFVLWEKNM